MNDIARKFPKTPMTWIAAVALAGTASVASMSPSRADEAQAKSLFKAMSDYVSSQKVISMDIDSNLEIMTKDDQKLALASSGTVTLNRPNKLHVTRQGGFANIELVFDGKTATLLGKNANAYAQAEAPGTIDQFIDLVRDKYERPVPGADLLMSDPYDEVMPMVVNTKDLGSGVIRGMECDHIAFRTDEVDFQLWIAQGQRPYPCRLVITSSKMDGAPQYTVDVRSWKTGSEVAPDKFSLEIPKDAKKLNPDDVPDFDELPGNFAVRH